jgi:hypothetical protein
MTSFVYASRVNKSWKREIEGDGRKVGLRVKVSIQKLEAIIWLSSSRPCPTCCTSREAPGQRY